MERRGLEQKGEGEDSPILREGHTSDGSRVAREVGNICLFLQIPDLHHTTPTHIYHGR